MLAAMLALHVALPVATWLAPPWTLLGAAPLVAGALLHRSAWRSLAGAGTTIEPEGRPARLVRAGPYRRTRNPMYLSGAPILLGYAVLLGTATPALVPLAYAAAATRWVAREEARLAERFGDEWEQYRASVRRWL